jgi:hypothetical protein
VQVRIQNNTQLRRIAVRAGSSGGGGGLEAVYLRVSRNPRLRTCSGLIGTADNAYDYAVFANAQDWPDALASGACFYAML